MITKEFETPQYSVLSFNRGLAYVIVDKRSRNERLLTHSAAFLFERDLDFLRLHGGSSSKNDSRCCRPDLLDQMVRRYWAKAGT